MREGSVLVIGAGGAIGSEAVRQLRARNLAVIATWRTHRPGRIAALQALGAETAQLDLEDRDAARRLIDMSAAVLFIPILTASAAAATHLRPGQPAVFFSSNNVAIDFEAPVYARLREGEAAVRKAAPHAVILRPTMIYGYPGDGNLSRLVRFMKRSPVTPMPGTGRALQQPVYYADLVEVAIEALFNETRSGKTAAVAGPGPVTLKDMYETAKAAAGARTAILSMPVTSAGTLMQSFEKTGVKFPIKSAQLLRAEKDKDPQGDHIVLTRTELREGLRRLAASIAE